MIEKEAEEKYPTALDRYYWLRGAYLACATRLLPLIIERDEEIERLKGLLRKQDCQHEFVSSVAYKGARICTKCSTII